MNQVTSMDAERIARDVQKEHEALRVLSQRRSQLSWYILLGVALFGIGVGTMLFANVRDFGSLWPQWVTYIMASTGFVAGLAALSVSVIISRRVEAAIELLMSAREK
jgi:hypothetical protein